MYAVCVVHLCFEWWHNSNEPISEEGCTISSPYLPFFLTERSVSLIISHYGVPFSSHLVSYNRISSTPIKYHVLDLKLIIRPATLLRTVCESHKVGICLMASTKLIFALWPHRDPYRSHRIKMRLKGSVNCKICWKFLSGFIFWLSRQPNVWNFVTPPPTHRGTGMGYVHPLMASKIESARRGSSVSSWSLSIRTTFTPSIHLISLFIVCLVQLCPVVWLLLFVAVSWVCVQFVISAAIMS